MDEAFLCVALVQEKGIHLLEKELEALRRRKARSRLLVTTTFQTASQPALSMASGLSVEVRIPFTVGVDEKLKVRRVA